MSDIDINQVLAQMRAMAAQAQGQTAAPAEATKTAEGPEFAEMFKQSLDAVNATMKASGNLSQSFQAGDPNVNLTDVMLAAQKSRVAFEAVTQVRNKLLDAYQEVMRMQF